ncbi:MAG: hypothetical protein Q4P78_08385, partial [Rothia sp. (in: high G+C Gram-positive bacteria)]|uniref:hypothetical protein n=1 Tax=Rothia sp. (in: high G+C Gram-positive bacteria) TaxID=1885016 RepID=UPI0026E0A3F6
WSSEVHLMWGFGRSLAGLVAVVLPDCGSSHADVLAIALLESENLVSSSAESNKYKMRLAT